MNQPLFSEAQAVVRVIAFAGSLAALASGGQPVQFSNIKFDPGEFWTVSQRSPSMVLQIRNEAVKNQVRITIEPAAPSAATLQEGMDAAWTAALAGRSINGEADKQDARDIEVGGQVLVQGAQVAPRGGIILAAIKAGNKLTKLTLTADNDVAYAAGAASATSLLSSLEVLPEQPPSGGTAVGGPGPLGPDPSDEFDWDGPDWFEYGIYDHDCRSFADEYNEFIYLNRGVAGCVQPRDVTYAEALATARKVLKADNAKAQYDSITSEDSKKFPKLFLAGAAARMMQADPFGALAHMVAGIDSAPNEPDIQFNLAAVLAQNGMPNESLAVLKYLAASDKKPQLAAGLKPDAAMAYLEGYSQMLRGKLPEAAARLSAAIAADPFLSEASQCLALVQASQGGNGLPAYKVGAFRFKVEKVVICANDRKTERPPVDKMFDTSKGSRPVLSDFRHPKNWQDLYKWMNDFAPRRAQETIARTEALNQRMSANPRPTPDDTPYGTWADRLSDLMEGLDENEPLLLRMKAEVDASEADCKRAGELHLGRMMKKLAELQLQAGSRHICPDLKDAINQCLSSMRPYLVHWETKQRRYAEAWYRMATGLNAHIAKNRWHACNAASIAGQIHGLDTTIFASMNGFYGAIAVPLAGIEDQCREPGDADGAFRTSADGPDCPAGMKGLGFKYSFDVGSKVKMGFKVDCQKFTVDLEYNLFKVGSGAEFGLGGFAQLEMAHKGDWTVFAGAKGSISSGVGVSEKAGIYVKGNAADGMTDLGGRVSVEASGKGTEFAVSKSDTMDFSIMPAPKPAKLGPRLKPFRGP